MISFSIWQNKIKFCLLYQCLSSTVVRFSAYWALLFISLQQYHHYQQHHHYQHYPHCHHYPQSHHYWVKVEPDLQPAPDGISLPASVFTRNAACLYITIGEEDMNVPQLMWEFSILKIIITPKPTSLFKAWEEEKIIW
jgi:hypothetical protein